MKLHGLFALILLATWTAGDSGEDKSGEERTCDDPEEISSTDCLEISGGKFNNRRVKQDCGSFMRMVWLPCDEPPPREDSDSGKSGDSSGKAGGGATCFAADQTLTLRSGATRRMDEAQVGDKVLTLGPVGFLYSEILYFHHSAAEDVGNYLKIETVSGATLEISELHLLYIAQNCGQGRRLPHQGNTVRSSWNFQFAKRAEVGACLGRRNAADELIGDRIRKITTVRSVGLYAPVTGEGTVVVNGLLASCYTNVEAQIPIHALHTGIFAFLRLWDNLLDVVSSVREEAPSSLLFLSRIADIAMPKSALAA